MDSTLLTILLLLVFATVVALVQSRRRDKCLRAFGGFHITMAEKGGDLTWGTPTIYASGMEISYAMPVETKHGHVEYSFLFYKEQYDAMDALYRYPGGLTPEQQQRRAVIIHRTAQPSLWRRAARGLRNWLSMIRDAVMQAVTVVIGVAKARQPGSAVLTTQEAQLKALSSEIIGHAGNAFDPMLEQHLCRRVVVEVTRNGKKHSYCGWLRDYTSRFVEIVDAQANTQAAFLPAAAYGLTDEVPEGLKLRLDERGRFSVSNQSAWVLHVDRLEAPGWSYEVDCIVPPDYTADVALPTHVDPTTVRVTVGAVQRIDMVIPRTHALIRHAAQAPSASLLATLTEVTTQTITQPFRDVETTETSPNLTA